MARDKEPQKICALILISFLVLQVTILGISCKSFIEKHINNEVGKPVNSTKPVPSLQLPSMVSNNSSTSNNKQNEQSKQKQQQLSGQSSNPANKANRTAKLESLDKLASDSNTNKPVRVESKTGRAIARMQPLKRQVDGNGELNGGGITNSRRNEDPWFLDQSPYPLQPYRFVYNIKGKNGLTEQYRQEVGDGKYLTGSYGYVLPDGIYRHVDYVADDRGFRAFIRTSEPGTANQNPSNVVINSNPVVTGPGVTYASDFNTNNENLAANLSYLPLSNYAPSSNIDYSNLASAGQTLARRPAGSIVNTPLRNFTSFSFTTPAPFLSPATPSPFNFRTSAFGDGYGLNPTSNNISASFSAAAAQSIGDSSLSSTLNKGAGIKLPQQGGASWSTSSDQYLDEDVFKRIKPAQLAPIAPPQLPLNNINYSRLGYFNTMTQDKPIQTPTIGNLFGNQRRAIELQSRSGPGKLSYDRLLSNQDSTGGTNKLNYDMNYVYHPESPLLSLERARSLAQLNQLNAAGPGLQYIRPLLSTDAGNLSPLSQVNSANQFNSYNNGIINLSSRSGTEHSSKSEEHHQKRTEIQSRQSSDTNNKLLVTSKEQQLGTKSGSGREFEYHQTTDHNLLPLNHPTGQLQPPPPYLNSKVNFENNVQFQAPIIGAIKGGPSRLQAPYAGFSQQQQQQQISGQAVKATVPNQYDRQVTIVPTSPLPPSPPAPPSQPEEPSGRSSVTTSQDFQQQSNPATLIPSNSGESQPEQQQATKSTLGPFEQEQQTTGTQFSSSTTAASSHDQYDQDHEQARKGSKSTVGDTKRSQQSESWLGATRPQSPSSISAPVRTVRMQPDDFRASMMMNDLRSMQNTFGLPQPPRLQREPLLHEIEQFQTTLNPKPHLDQILSSRMNRVDALLSSARAQQADNNDSNKSNGSRTQNEPQNKLTSSGNQQAASMQQSVALSALGSKSNEIVDDPHLAGLHDINIDKSSNNKSFKQKKPVATATTTTTSTNNNLDELISLGKQRFQTGPVIKLSNGNSLDGNNFNEAPLVPLMNETLFDARRLSAANKARLQAEKVSELEKFQQRLRTQQLLLEQIKNPTIEKPSSIHQHLASATNKKPLHQLAAARGISNTSSSNLSSNQPVAEQVNSHVKYDEEADGSIASSRAGAEARGHNQSHTASSLEGYKPILFKIEPTGRDYTRLRRQNSGNEPPSPSQVQNEQQKLANSDDKLANISLNAATAKKLEPESGRKLIKVHTKPHLEPVVSSTGDKSISEFARQIKQWPSILQQNNMDTTNLSNSTDQITNKPAKLFDQLIDSKPPGVALEESGNKNLANKSVSSTPISSSGQQQAATNTINLDFINSVTALSVDHLNPFAISSVNPAVQRSFVAGTNLAPKEIVSGEREQRQSNKQHNNNGSEGTESRLSPHKLGEVGPNMGVATTSARYFNSPEILAALDYHEKRDTSAHLKSLLPDESANSHKSTSSIVEMSHGLRPTNHRFGIIAPYSMKQIDLNQLGTRKQVSISSAGASSGSIQEESLSSQRHKSFESPSSTMPKLKEISNHKLSQQYGPIKDSSSSLVNKDGFEIQNSAHVQVDNQRFYEVVSSISPPNDYASSIASSQAFRDPQLSISALTNK